MSQLYIMTFYYFEYFHEWVKCLDNKVLEYNLLIRSGVQLYLYSDIKYN